MGNHCIFFSLIPIKVFHSAAPTEHLIKGEALF